MIKKVMENGDMTDINFDLPSDVLDEIQHNIQSIIESFDIPDDNKFEVIRKINFMYTQTKQLSITDALTNLYNRRYFETTFKREFARAKRYNSDLSLAVIDIDFFKQINDTYGHLCGDYVLRELSWIMVDNFRQTDMVFRYGGEEFVILLTETPFDTASIPVERLRKAVESTRFKFKGTELNVTISAGISSSKDVNDISEMFENADKALYMAKEEGRNRVRTFG